MQIKSNTMLKILVLVVLFSSIGIGVKSCGPTRVQEPDIIKPNTVADLTPEELHILGIEGDTADDTLRTLVGRIKVIQGKQDALERQNISLIEENAKLKGNNESVDTRISAAIKAVKQEGVQTQQTMQAEQKRLADMVDNLRNTVSLPSFPAHADLPIGLGLESDSKVTNSAPSQTMVWVEPLDRVQLDRNGKPLIDSMTNTVNNNTAGSTQGGFPSTTSFAILDNNEITRQKAELDRVAKNQQSIEESELPVYTLPENSTLIGSRGMTALLGRVPIDGKVTDPYPFKVLIGKDNLTANGIELPDVEGAIVSGTATGDWVLSCVRGDAHSITFVFTDGTVRTVPKPAKSTDGSNNRANNGGSIGWLSDENGIPCLSGTRKSNASSYLPTLFALSGASAAADAMANNQMTSTVDSGTVTSTLTGSAGQAALGKALSGSTSEVAAWVKARYGQTFDAVYVQPGARVAVHITRQIPIDYEEKGRKVRYDFNIGQPRKLD